MIATVIIDLVGVLTELPDIPERVVQAERVGIQGADGHVWGPLVLGKLRREIVVGVVGAPVHEPHQVEGGFSLNPAPRRATTCGDFPLHFTWEAQGVVTQEFLGLGP